MQGICGKGRRMLLPILICNQQTSLDLDGEMKEFIKDVVKRTLEYEGATDREVSIALIDDAQMEELNLRYRRREGTTDVLSFPQEGKLLGDVIISVPQAIRQASQYGHSLRRELGFLLVHGLLHLLGYDHQNREDDLAMQNTQKEILNKIRLTGGC